MLGVTLATFHEGAPVTLAEVGGGGLLLRGEVGV